jgi:DcmR-like sensory protein
MRASSSSMLRTLAPRAHVVRLYTDEGALAETVAEFLAHGARRGEAAIVIATPSHRAAFIERLATRGLDLVTLHRRRQLTSLDAERCLARFMIGGVPDRDAFLAVVAEVLEPVWAAGFPRVRLYGEMVDLLWDRNLPGAVGLETLWNEVLADDRLCLLCAYGIDNFDRHAHRTLLHQISGVHSHVVPVDDCERLEYAVDRAYHDVFGPEADADALREVVAKRDDTAVAMPAAQAALVGLRSVGTKIADEVLERARYHYRAHRAAA